MNKMANTTIDLLRHGDVAGKSALYGHTDVALSDDGWQKMQSQTESLPIPDVIISSPLSRCYAFAKNTGNTKLIPVQTSNDLMECNFGRWDGVAFDDLHGNLQNEWPLLDAFWQSPSTNTPPQGEALAAMYQRVCKGFTDICQQYKGQRVLVVSHGGVIRQIVASILGIDWQGGDLYQQLSIEYASLTRIVILDVPNAKPILKFIGKPAPLESQF
ncbi:alpha-ribazole phosphatase [Agaribacter marinus]|uniref:Alpha-ribazole phosphatase n=2 Tax=Agaribacter marinus TaxID=1431249 RepID=A0AA37WI16_9ALTE|nr:alpha-ribazole phosphatase [Agaribacter marinus]